MIRQRIEKGLSKELEELRKRIEALEKENAELKSFEYRMKTDLEFSKNVFETIREPLLILNGGLKVVQANRFFYETFKVIPEETIGHFVYDLGKRQWDIPRLRELLEEIIPKNTRFDNFEVEHDFPSIGKKVMLLNARRVYQLWDREQHILLAIEDITERKRVEERLQHLNQVLRAIRNVNQLIVREHDPGALLKGACEILQRTRNYRLVWIGDLDERTKRIVPVSWAGEGSEYLSNLVITNDESELGRCPTGTVPRKGKPDVCQDIAQDPRMNPWKDSALRHGFSSCAALPIAADNQLYGILNVCSAQPNLFGPDEIQLLREVSDDLALALKSIELEKERKKAQAELRVSEEKYRMLAEQSLQGIIIIQDGRIVFANKTLSDITGYTVDELLSLPSEKVIGMVAPEDQPLVWGRFKDRLGGKVVPSRYEYRGIRKDGSIAWIEMLATRIEYQGRPAIQGAMIDITERKRAEEALRQSEERYRTLVEGSFDGIFIQKGPKIIYANQRLYEMLGNDPGELEGKDHWLVYHPDDQDLTRERAKARMRGEDVPPRYEVRVHRKDGSSFDGEVFARRIMFGEEPGIQVWIRDLTERRRAEEKIKASEERYRTLVESSSDAILMLDTERRIISMNQGFCDLFGYSKDEAVGKSVRIIHASDDAFRSFGERIYPIVRREGSCRVEWNFVRKDESQIPGEIVISEIKSSDGSTTGYVSIVRDITERKRAEEALRASEEKYRIIADNTADVIVSMDLNLGFTYISPSVLRVLGFSVQEAMGQTLGRLLTQDCLQNVRKVFEEEMKLEASGVADPERVRMMELEAYKKDGSTIYCEANLSFLRDKDKRPIGVVAIVRNITDRKRAEHELVSLQEQLRQAQKLEAIGRLAGGIAHDFNNLLTVIRGNCQLSLMDLREGDPLHSNIKDIERSAESAANLTRQLLAFSRRQILEMRVVDLNTLIRDLEKMIKRIIGEDIELVTFLPEALGRVKADPGQMEQAIVNIVVNARDAMPHGGKLTIETSNVELDAAYAKRHVAVKPGPYVMLSISDTGVGMTPEVKDRIFEPFFTTKEMGKGTGLGLSTVYGIVKQSGGNIWVYSEPGKGATFKIYLPRVDEPLTQLKEEVGREVPRGNETVLVVEDEETVRKLAIRLLKRLGYNVLEASDGGKAFMLCEEFKKPIHLILTDVVMPGMSGRKLVDRLIQIHPEMRVLYMSGYSDNAIIHHGILEEGMNFIQKPFTVENLAKKVREALSR